MGVYIEKRMLYQLQEDGVFEQGGLKVECSYCFFFKETDVYGKQKYCLSFAASSTTQLWGSQATDKDKGRLGTW